MQSFGRFWNRNRNIIISIWDSEYNRFAGSSNLKYLHICFILIYCTYRFLNNRQGHTLLYISLSLTFFWIVLYKAHSATYFIKIHTIPLFPGEYILKYIANMILDSSFIIAQYNPFSFIIRVNLYMVISTITFKIWLL